VTPATARLADDEQRLAALWEDELDDGNASAAHDDETTTFFPISREAGMRARVTQSTTRTSPRTQLPHMRRGPMPRQLAGAAVCGLAAAVVMLATHGTPAGGPHEPTPGPRPRAAQATAVPTAPAPPNRTGTTRRHDHTPEVPRKTEHTTRRRAQTSRAHLGAPRPRLSRRPIARPSDAGPRRQPAPPPVPVPPVPVPAATSSACDEFPPC
jgi:hypothetical protein